MAREQEAAMDCREATTDLRTLRTTSLGDLMQRYLDEVTPRKRSAHSEAARLGKMLRAPMADVPLVDLTPAIVAAYRDERALAVQPGTIRRELSIVRCILQIARKEWGFPFHDNLTDRVARPAPPEGRERRLDRGDLARLEAALPQSRNVLFGPLVLFANETAMRRGEILNLRWRDIPPDSRTAHIPTTKTFRLPQRPTQPRAQRAASGAVLWQILLHLMEGPHCDLAFPDA